jgi:transcriptional regulator with GAF, ATPase, and Fis domain
MSQAQRRAEALERAHTQSDGILTADPDMERVLQTAHQIATTDLPVLIEGETGTGKELIARAVYRHSARVKGPFIALNCAAIPASLIGSELFGFVQGAFTGANRDRVGFIGAAHRGTLFLDEIGDLPLDLQPHLLRVLQSGEFTRLGNSRTEQADVRFIAATNRDLDSEVKAGRFRADLFSAFPPLSFACRPCATGPTTPGSLPNILFELRPRATAGRPRACRKIVYPHWWPTVFPETCASSKVKWPG